MWSVPVVRAWGSVLTAAFDLTLTLACDPIIFVGADLAYTHRQPYCRGTTFEHEWACYTALGYKLRDVWENMLSGRTVLSQLGVNGEDVLTAPHLVEFRDWLLARIREPPGPRVVNATGAGILFGSGIQQADLGELLESQPVREPSLHDAITALLNRRAEASRTEAVVDGFAAIVRELGPGWNGSANASVSDWLVFGRPLLAPTDIQAAVIAAHDSLNTPRAEQVQVTGAPVVLPGGMSTADAPSRFYEVDRVGVMRALATGDHMAAGTLTASRAIDGLLAMGELTVASGSQPAYSPDAHLVPLSCRYTWTVDAAPIVESLEKQLFDACRTLGAAAGSKSHGGEFWAGPIDPVVESVEGDANEVQGERLSDQSLDDETTARATLTAYRQGLDAIRHWAPAVPLNRRLKRLVLAILRGVLDPRLHASANTAYSLELVELHGPDRPRRLPVRIDTLMRAVTGTLALPDGWIPESIVTAGRVWPELRVSPVPHATATEPRQLFLSNDIAYVEPEVLTGRGLSRGASLATDGDGCAVFTPWPSRQNVRISSDGRIEDGSSWPCSITGYVPWGDEGGALAWNRDDSVVLLRSRAGTDPVVSHVPFQPALVAPGNNGSVFWYALGGGLWEWVPGGSGRFIVDTPHSCTLRLDGQELVLAPVVPDSRRRFVHEWRCDPSGGGRRETATGLEGQCASVAQRAGWTARTHPYSDLVRLDLADGPRVQDDGLRERSTSHRRICRPERERARAKCIDNKPDRGSVRGKARPPEAILRPAVLERGAEPER